MKWIINVVVFLVVLHLVGFFAFFGLAQLGNLGVVELAITLPVVVAAAFFITKWLLSKFRK